MDKANRQRANAVSGKTLLKTNSPRFWALLSTALSLVILAIGIIYYRAEKSRIRSEKYDDVASVARLKVNEISQWRLERLSDVSAQSNSSLTRRAIVELLHASSNSQLRAMLEERLSIERRLEPYSDAFVIDTTGRVLIPSSRAGSRIDSSEIQSVRDNLSGGKPFLTDLFKGSDGIVHIDVMGPVTDGAGRPVAFFVLRSDAERFLYPLLGSWPVASQTSETFIVERRGDRILLLSSLRFNPGAEFNSCGVRDKMARPAAEAVSGKTGFFEGVDYRGKDVLADLRQIPDSPWYMVSKVDASEIDDEVSYRGGTVGLLIAMFILMSAAVTAYVYRHRESSLYRRLYETESKRYVIQGEYKTTLYSIGDAVITTNVRGEVMEMNPVAENLTGWKEADAKGRPLADVFRILNEDSRAQVDSPVERALKEGIPVGLANHTVLISKDGREIPIADSAAPIRDQSDAITGVVLIFRDQVKEREAERKLKESELQLKRSQSVTRVGYYILDIKSGVWSSSEMLDAIFGIDETFDHDLAGWLNLVHPDDRQEMSFYFTNDVLMERRQFDREYRVNRRSDGAELWVHGLGELEFDEGGQPIRMFGTIQDVTERKRAEESLRESEQKFRTLVENSSAAVMIFNGERLVYVNPAAAHITGYSVEELTRMHPLEIIDPEFHEEIKRDMEDRIGGMKVPSDVVHPIMTKDGKRKWIEFTGNLIEYEGRPAVIAMWVDITERKHAEEALRKSEAKFRAVVENSHDGIIFADARGIVRYASSGYEAMSGYSGDERIGKSGLELIHPEDVEMVKEKLERALRNPGIAQTSEYRVRHKNGEWRWIESTVRNLLDNPDVREMVVVTRDITERKLAAERLRERDVILNRAVEAAPMILFTLDNDGIFQLSTGAGLKSIGLKPGQVVGMSHFDVYKDLEIANENVRRVLKGESISFVSEALGVVWDIRYSPLYDLNNEIKGMVGTAIDVTENKRAIDALRDSELRYRTLFDNAPDGVLIVDPETGRHIAFNNKAHTQLGYSREEFANMGVSDYEVLEDAATTRSHILRILEEGSDTFETKHRTKQGDTRNILVMVQKLELNGRPVLNCIFRDITEVKEVERKAQEVQERYRAVIDNSNDGITITDTDGKFLLVNDAFSSMTGHSTDELLSMTFRELMVSGTKPELLQQVAEKGISRTRETSLIRKDGTRKKINLNVSRIIVGDEMLFQGIIRDVTDLRDSEEIRRLQSAAMEAAADAIVMTDREGLIQYVNKAFTELTGYTFDEAIGNTPRVLKSERQDPRFYRALWETILSGRVWRGELVNRRKDGSTYDESMSITPVKDNKGEVTHFIAVKRDVTERKEAENALKESESKFRALVEASASAILIHDGKHIFYANPMAMKLTGHTKEDISRLSVMDLVHPDYRKLAASKMEARLEGGEMPDSYEIKVVKKSGEDFWIDLNSALIEYEGKPALLISAYDISDRKKLEEQLIQAQKMEGIGRLAGGVAHDYNNMLGVVIGYTQLIQKKIEKGNPIYRYVELIDSAARRGADLTRQLLAFARREMVSPKPINPNAAISSLQRMLMKLIGEDISLKFLPGNGTWNIKMDPTQFDQVLVNLATNSRDAIHGVGTIALETSNVVLDGAIDMDKVGVPPGEYVVLTVTDDGAGMGKDTLDKIFEPFFTTKPKGRGTGLGLSTVYGIVKQNGGSVAVESQEGKGTTFKIYIPRYVGEAELVETESESGSLNGGETVLVVEDQAELLDLARSSLGEYGYKVIASLSPGEGISICEKYEGKIHLLLTDVIMPGMNGKDLRDRIQAIKPDIKTIFMSGYTSDIIANSGVLDEGVEFIQKPFRPNELAKKIREVLDS